MNEGFFAEHSAWMLALCLFAPRFAIAYIGALLYWHTDPGLIATAWVYAVLFTAIRAAKVAGQRT